MQKPERLVLQASDEEEEKKALAAAMDEWNKVVNIHNLKYLFKAEETFVAKEVFLSQNFLQGPKDS